MHPQTRKRLEALPNWKSPEGIVFHEPFGFHDFNRLQLGAACVLSDSGTIAEGSTVLGFPAITLRDSIERPEALDTGRIVMAGLDTQDVIAAVEMAIDDPSGDKAQRGRAPADHCVDNTSERAVNFLVSTVRRHAGWAGLR